MSTAAFIAKRLYSSRNGSGGQVSRPAVAVATVGVAVGMVVMIVAVSIVLGFKHEIRSKVLDVEGHIQVMNHRSLVSQESLPVLIDDDVIEAVRMCPDVTGCERFVVKAGMLKSDEGFYGVQFTGTEGIDTRFAVSKMLAQAMRVAPGSRINAYFFENTIRARRFTIDTLYATNMEQFDKRMVMAPFATVHALTGWDEDQCSGLRIHTDGRRDLNDVAYDISRLLAPYSLEREFVVLTAEELSPQTFAWLSLLDTNVWIILSLMLCVASFTMVSGLLIIILERTLLISLLKAVGATNALAYRVFMHLAMMLLVRAMVWGNAVALLLLWLQHTFRVVRLDAAEYYLDTVPVEFNWLYFAAVNAGTLVISAAALLLPAVLVAHIRPAAVMRIE